MSFDPALGRFRVGVLCSLVSISVICLEKDSNKKERRSLCHIWIKKREKNYITRGLEEINFLHKPNNQYLSFPLQKSNGWPLSNGT